MKYIKILLETIILMIISLCAFGGGFIIFGLPIMYIFEPNPQICEIITFITIFVPMPFAWYIAPKIADKIL